MIPLVLSFVAVVVQPKGCLSTNSGFVQRTWYALQPSSLGGPLTPPLLFPPPLSPSNNSKFYFRCPPSMFCFSATSLSLFYPTSPPKSDLPFPLSRPYPNLCLLPKRVTRFGCIRPLPQASFLFGYTLNVESKRASTSLV